MSKTFTLCCPSDEPTEIGENGELLCHIGNDSYLADVPGGCDELVGRLTLDHNANPVELWKLYNITTIFGQLTIKNTSFIGLSALWKLMCVVNLSGKHFCEPM